MITNAIERVVTNAVDGSDPISNAIRSVSTMSNEVLFAAGLFALNMILKRMPSVKNDWIPMITAVVGPFAYCGLVGVSGRNIIIGFVCGSATVHVHSMVKPFLKKYLGVPTGDTVEINRTSVTPGPEGSKIVEKTSTTIATIPPEPSKEPKL